MTQLPAPHDFIDIDEGTRTVHGVTARVPVRATATLTSAVLGRGSTPVHGNDPPGFVRGTCPEHHQRGHLIGNQLGGPGINPNLVTLSEGTNHPLMAEFEGMIAARVRANPGVAFTYVVDVMYREDDYLDLSNGRLGVMGNPYCQFPAPSHLLLSFYNHVAGVISYPLNAQLPAYDMHGNALIIPNGVFKFHYGSPAHVAANCWAAVHHTDFVSCAQPGCGSKRNSATTSWMFQWHRCPNCNHVLCGTCGRKCASVGFFSRARMCPVCTGANAIPMMLW